MGRKELTHAWCGPMISNGRLGDKVSYVARYRLWKGEPTLIFDLGKHLKDHHKDFRGKARHRFALRRVRR
jgi:hypothetical protein